MRGWSMALPPYLTEQRRLYNHMPFCENSIAVGQFSIPQMQDGPDASPSERSPKQA